MDNKDKHTVELMELAEKFETWQDVEKAYEKGEITAGQLLSLLEVFNLL